MESTAKTKSESSMQRRHMNSGVAKRLPFRCSMWSGRVVSCQGGGEVSPKHSSTINQAPPFLPFPPQTHHREEAVPVVLVHGVAHLARYLEHEVVAQVLLLLPARQQLQGRAQQDAREEEHHPPEALDGRHAHEDHHAAHGHGPDDAPRQRPGLVLGGDLYGGLGERRECVGGVK